MCFYSTYCKYHVFQLALYRKFFGLRHSWTALPGKKRNVEKNGTNRGVRSVVRCIALLRGINVSGRKIANKADLKRAFESLGFQNVRTYAQSGNVIFDCKRAETAKMAECIEEKISEIFGFSSNVIIKTQHELQQIVENNPLVDRANVGLTSCTSPFCPTRQTKQSRRSWTYY